MQIKPIETQYKGYRFRSRLEARWAVFFDKLEVKWEYEIEGFELPTGRRYLPDFYLSDLDVYIEIKPTIPYNYFSDNILIIAGPDAPKKNELLDAILINEEARSGNKMRERCFVAYGSPYLPTIVADENNGWKLSDGCILICPMMIVTPESSFVQLSVCAFAFVNGGKFLDIWPYYLPTKKVMKQNPILPKGFMWRGYVGDGVCYDHPDLMKAYKAARKARFEFGENGR